MKTPEMKPKTENKESKREIINLEIAGKNYEVIKTHFMYPEHIIKENGGVEGYDRFRLSWEQFDEDNRNNELKLVSEQLGVGTEMKEETISHYVNGVYRGNLKWEDNKFFLNKPFDIKDILSYLKEFGKLPINEVVYQFTDNNPDLNILNDLMREGLTEEELSSLGMDPEDPNEVRLCFLKEGVDRNKNIVHVLEKIIEGKDLVMVESGVMGMSFAQGSNLSSTYKSDFAPGPSYNTPFFNFNKRNTAFDSYIKNIQEYKNKIKTRKYGTRLHIEPCVYDRKFHPSFGLVFTKDFPAFRWCMADTAYVPMKDGPSFFKFYSRDKENKNPE